MNYVIKENQIAVPGDIIVIENATLNSEYAYITMNKSSDYVKKVVDILQNIKIDSRFDETNCCIVIDRPYVEMISEDNKVTIKTYNTEFEPKLRTLGNESIEDYYSRIASRKYNRRK